MSAQPVPAVLARIREREEQRQAALQRREASRVPTEALLSHCADLEQRVRTAYCEARSLLEEQKPADLEAAAAALSAYEKAVADASGHLPTYEAQQLHACMKSLKEELTQLRAHSAPKKRFSFARKPAPAPAAPDAAHGAGKGGSLQPCADLPSAASSAVEPGSAQGLYSESHGSGGKGCSEPESGSKPAASSTTQTARRTDGSPAVSSRSISGRSHERIEDTLDEKGGPLVISDLTSCTVCIGGWSVALRMHGLRDCTVIVGPVQGSAFVQDVENCLLIIKCNQARIHKSTDTTFLLRVKSNPIIEHCTRLRFGPIPLSGEGDKGRGEHADCKWLQVQDFGWLRSTPSPNWSTVEDTLDQRPELRPMLAHWQGASRH